MQEATSLAFLVAVRTRRVLAVTLRVVSIKTFRRTRLPRNAVIPETEANMV